MLDCIGAARTIVVNRESVPNCLMPRLSYFSISCNRLDHSSCGVGGHVSPPRVENWGAGKVAPGVWKVVPFVYELWLQSLWVGLLVPAYHWGASWWALPVGGPEPVGGPKPVGEPKPVGWPGLVVWVLFH